MSLGPPIIEVRELRKAFTIPRVRRETVREHVFNLFRSQPTEVLDVLTSISFHVGRGESIGIMGRNGSGKSTLLKILAGIYRADAGSLVVRGALTPVLGLGAGWNGDLNARDNALLLGTALGMTIAEVEAVLPEILAVAELDRFAALPLKYFSTGMSARLAYGIAFAAVRDILLLDEIFAVGDAAFRARCRASYPVLRERGCTTILVSHDPEAICGLCDRALLLEAGRVILDDRSDVVAAAYLRLLEQTSA